MVTMPLKQLPISTEHWVKDPLIIGQSGSGFRSSAVGIRVFKINRVENSQENLVR